MIVGLHSTKLPQSWDIGSDDPSIPAISISVLQFLVDGHWQPAKPRTGMSIIWRVSCFYCTVVAICISFVNCREGPASHSLHLALAMVMVTFRTFSGLFTHPFLSSVIGVLLHVRCIPHQNSQRLF